MDKYDVAEAIRDHMMDCKQVIRAMKSDRTITADAAKTSMTEVIKKLMATLES